MSQENVMRKLKVAKITLNIGAGTDTQKLKNGQKLLKHITGVEPVTTKTQKRIQGWGLRPGLPVGCKVTLRGKKAEAMLKNLLSAKEKNLRESQFDDFGNLSFGIPEYIDIKDVKYLPEVGVMGLEVAVTLERPGYSVKRRRYQPVQVGKKHQVRKDEAIDFMKSEYGVNIE